MGLEVGLFISDDPDDYQVFQEAIDEISRDIVLVNIGDSKKALRYLRHHHTVPDYIFIDLTMSDSYASLIRELNFDERIRNVPKLALVDNDARARVDHQFFLVDKGLDFADLKHELSRFLKID
jgi:hypothetical protein